MASSINLANVNITIQQFQNIASGKYNAGEVRLTSETSLGKINDSVGSWDSNVKAISHDEVLAIKEAFVRALQKSGVGLVAINDIRRRIGLAPDPALPKALAERSIKPLTRQQIREILDEHKETINLATGRQTIRTHAEIYARHGAEAIRQYEQTRRATNAAFMKNRSLDIDRRLLDIQRVIAGDVHFRTDEDRRLLVTSAELLRSEILKLSDGGNLSEDPLYTLSFRKRGGVKVTFALGTSPKEFIGKLDDMLLQLRSERQAPESTTEARREYVRASAAGAAGTTNWITSLPDDPRGGFKARTVAVGMLFELGIGDHASLSLLNRVSDRDAITFLSFLMVNPEKLKGQTLRNSAAFQRLAQQAAANVQVPRDMQAYIPVQSPAEFNHALDDSLRGSLDQVPLRFKNMADGIRGELVARFGTDATPANMTFAEAVSTPALYGALSGNGRLADYATPEALKARIMPEAVKETARRFLVSALKPMLKLYGLPETSATGLASNVTQRNPNILERISQARNPAEAAAAVGEFKNEIGEAMRRRTAVARCMAQAKDWARAELARLMGVPVSTLEGNDITFNRIDTKANRLSQRICGGDDPANTDQEIEAKFRELAVNFANERAALLAQADALEGLSQQTRDEIKKQVLLLDVVTGIDLAEVRDAMGDLHIAELTAALAANGDRNGILNAMGAAGERIKNAAHAFVNAHNGSPELFDAAKKLMLVFAVCEQPVLRPMLDAFLNRPDMANVNIGTLLEVEGLAENAVDANVFMSIVSPDGFSADNAAIADGIANGRCHPLAAQALNRALEDLGLGNISAGAKAALLSGAGGRALADQVRQLNFPVTPAILRDLARMHFSNAAAAEATKRFAAAIGQTLGFGADADSASRTQEALFRRYPNLTDKVAEAVSSAAARGENVQVAANAALQPYATVAEIAVRAFREVSLADARALDTAAARIADRTGLDENTVRARIDMGAYRFNGEGVLANIRDGIANDIANPDIPLDTLNDYNIDGIRTRCAEELDRFVDQKAGVIAAIDALPVSDAMKGELASKALANRAWNDPALVNAARDVLANQAMQTQIAVLGNVFKPENLAKLQDDDLLNFAELFATAVNNALGNAIPQERRAEMAGAVREIIAYSVVDRLGEPFTAMMEKLVADGRFDKIENLAAGKAGDNAAYAKRFFDIAHTNLVNDWTTDEIAGMFNALNDDEDLNERVRASVKKGPGLFAKHSAGLDANLKAALKAFIATLDLRDKALAGSEWAIRMKVIEFRIAGEGFTTQGSPAANEALALGYAPAELPKLQQVADFYRQATGCTDAEAYIAALDPKSDARRLFAFGGRFVESAENFAAGLRLQREFKTWFATSVVQVKAAKTHPEGASVTAINADSNLFTKGADFAFEKFLFEEIALNPAIPLDAENPHAVFDMEANPATRFVGRGYTNGCIATVAQIPPEKRSFVYKVFDILSPLGNDPMQVRARRFGSSDSVEILARLLRNYDKVAEMDRNGTLTRENFYAQLYPDVPGTANMTNREIIKASENITYASFMRSPPMLGAAANFVNECGLTATEAVEAVKAGRIVPKAPYVAAATGSITEFGNPGEARDQAVLDLLRPAYPTFGKDGAVPAVSPDGMRFKAVFPDGTTLASGNKGQANAIADKIAEFCGAAHHAQCESVYFAFTQGAENPVYGAFMALGVFTSEHMPVTYTLSKNAETGAITIRYSEPEGFPVKFSWETTIDTDGKAVSTPFEAKVDRLTAENARKLATDAARRMNSVLSEAQLARAAELIETHCVEMNVKNAGLFANFIVQLPLDGNEKDIRRAVAMANSIRQWRDIEPGDQSLAELERLIKEEVVDDIAQYTKPEKRAQNYKEPYPTLHDTFVVDLGRSTVVINGKEHPLGHTDKGKAIDDFKKALEGKPKAQAVISSLMQQGSAVRIMRLQSKTPTAPTDTRPNPPPSFMAPGAEKFVNRTRDYSIFSAPEIAMSPKSRNELQVSEDGNTAVVKIRKTAKINVGVEMDMDNMKVYGDLETVETITLDLTGDNPRVVDVHLGQKINV